MEFENIVPIIRQWPFIDQWNITKEIIDQSDVEFFDVLYRLALKILPIFN